ncbi:MAG: virginiamycin B lyase family protein [Candidatus Binatia bacterium]
MAHRAGRIIMGKRTVALIVTITIVAIVHIFTQAVSAQDRAGALQGVIKDNRGEPVAGAFVKMHNADRRLTFMVISQERGRYSVNTLPRGKYTVQAIGGEFQSEHSAAAEVAPGAAATVDLALSVTRAPQLAPAWPGRLPGQRGGEADESRQGPPPLPEGEGREIIQAKCVSCHDAQRTIRVRADRNRWNMIIQNMRAYSQGSTLAKDLTDREVPLLLDYMVANYGPSARAAARPKPDPNSRLPRVLMTGDSMKYMAVEYELPNNRAEPHEVTVDGDGNGWVTQRVGGKIGRLDGKALTYSEYVPPPGPSPMNRLNAINRAADNKLWFVDGGPNRRWLNIDPKSQEFAVFELPKLKNGSASGNTMRVHPNGTVWLNSIAANQVIRLDPKTRQFTVYDVPAGVKRGRTANPYGMAFSGDGKVWFIENAVNQMGRLDPATGKIDEFPIPVKDPVARKGGMDSAGDIWVGLHGAGKVMKIDYKTTEMKIYTPPTDDSGPYSVQGDPKSHLVWFSQQHVDQMARFDPKSETFTEFPLPSAESDPRRIEVDPSNSNRIWWTGNLAGRMGYVELIK